MVQYIERQHIVAQQQVGMPMTRYERHVIQLPDLNVKVFRYVQVLRNCEFRVFIIFLFVAVGRRIDTRALCAKRTLHHDLPCQELLELGSLSNSTSPVILVNRARSRHFQMADNDHIV